MPLVETRRAGKPETLAVEQWPGETVYSGNTTGILDEQPGARASIMEIERRDGKAGGRTRSLVVEPGAQAVKPGTRAMDQG